jgi:capsular exopolysaccharide synthesis family protein
MKKHQAEQAQQAAEAAPAPGVEQPAANTAGKESPSRAALPSVMAQITMQPPAAPPRATSLPPADAGKHLSPILVTYHNRGGKITEEYRALRTNLLAQNPNEKFCYLITSAQPDEGKTVTCLNLGIVMAERVDRKTIIIDCDLRKRQCAAMLGVPSTPGVAELLRGEATFKDVVQSTPYPNLFFIPSGAANISEIGELIGRPEAEDLVGQLRRQYDYVIFDTPPISITSDAGMLGKSIGEALVVVRMNKTKIETVERAIEMLRSANIKPVGLILTHQKYHIPSYLYRYS